MFKNLFACILVMMAIQAHAQEVVYDKNVEVRKLAEFSSISVSGPIVVYLSQSTENVVAVSAGDEKYNSKIKTEVKNDKLIVSLDGGMWNTYNMGNRKINAYVSVKDLSRISLNGAAVFVIKGNLKSADLRVEISGASELKGDITIDKLKLDASGASVLKLSGAIVNAKIDVSGASKISASNLIIEHVKIDASGAAVIKFVVSKELNADASGGAVIAYKGSPSVINKNASGGAVIKNSTEGE